MKKVIIFFDKEMKLKIEVSKSLLRIACQVMEPEPNLFCYVLSGILFEVLFMVLHASLEDYNSKLSRGKGIYIYEELSPLMERYSRKHGAGKTSPTEGLIKFIFTTIKSC